MPSPFIPPRPDSYKINIGFLSTGEGISVFVPGDTHGAPDGYIAADFVKAMVNGLKGVGYWVEVEATFSTPIVIQEF